VAIAASALLISARTVAPEALSMTMSCCDIG
jgi:hypothetical protein